MDRHRIIHDFRGVSLCLAAWASLALAPFGCTREVVVEPGTQSEPFTVNGPGGAAAGGAAGSSVAPGVVDPPGIAPGAAGSDGSTGAGGQGEPVGVGPRPTEDGGSVDFMGGIDQSDPAAEAFIADMQVLAHGLSSIELPAVGSDGVSLVQYSGPASAFVLHVSFAGASEVRHGGARASYAYTAASGGRHVALLYTMATYGVYENGGMNDLSGAQTAYKEFLTANDRGLAWVEYDAGPTAMAGPLAGSSTLGAIVFQTSGTGRSTITDAQRYRARIDLSDTHAAFVEYASTAAGTPGQIVVQPLDGGEPITAAPSANHQDRPAIDGDWVVWEEYLNTSDAVIRARNLVTSEVRDVSASTGFRTNPDIRGTRVVWEDQQSGRGDIHFVDLAADVPARIAVSGRGHSSGARITGDGLVWTEAQDGHIGLLYARWL